MSRSRTRIARRTSWFAALLVMLLIPAQLFAQESIPTPETNRPLVPLYVSFAVLQALDVHSTTRALGSIGVEGNPLMRGVARQPAGLIALKAGGAASTIWLSHRLSKRSRTGAFILMAAVNSAYAMVVAHNYRAGR